MPMSDVSGRARLGDLDWEIYPDPHDRETSPVKMVNPGDPNILYVQFRPGFTAGEHWHPYDTVYVMTKGSLRFGDEGTFGPGTVRWVKAGHSYGPEETAEGCEFLLISLGGPVGLNWSDIYTPTRDHVEGRPDSGKASLDALAWEDFPDPYGRPTSPVKVVSAESPYILYVKFDPYYSAGEHWHPDDTIYFIRQGSLRFGDEGVFGVDDVRWVRGGHSYGPEETGADGCEFFLVSKSPVGLNWSDLVPPPHPADSV
jgi:hypothetical protein